MKKDRFFFWAVLLWWSLLLLVFSVLWGLLRFFWGDSLPIVELIILLVLCSLLSIVFVGQLYRWVMDRFKS